MDAALYASILLTAVVLYAPGYFLIRSCRFSRIISLTCAPVVGVPLYCFIAIILSLVGISCSQLLLFDIAFAFSIVVFILQHKKLEDNRYIIDLPHSPQMEKHPNLVYVLPSIYVALGLLIALTYYVGTLSSPGSFVQAFDNIHHLGLIQSFVFSGDWSSLHTTLYAGDPSWACPFSSSGFYPAAWNMIAAFSVSTYGASTAVAANAVNFVCAALVFPLSMYLLMRILFAQRLEVVAAGAVVTLGFTSFPWGFFIFGPLYPNMMAFSMVPAAASLFILALDFNITWSKRCMLLLFFGLSIIGFGFSHPNAVFLLVVFLGAYCIYKASVLCEEIKGNQVKKIFTALALLCVVLALMLLAASVIEIPRVFDKFREKGYLSLLIVACTCAIIWIGTVGAITLKARKLVLVDLIFDSNTSKANKNLVRASLVLLMVSIVGFFWCACLVMPFMRGVVTHSLPAAMTATDAAVSILNAGFIVRWPQYFMAVFVVTGIVASLRNRRLRWLVGAYLFMCLSYFMAACTDGVPKFIVSGFWYNDPYRVAACAAILAIPLAALGAYTIASLVANGINRILSRRSKIPLVLSAVVLLVAFCVSNYLPVSLQEDDEHITPLGIIGTTLELYNSNSGPLVYDADEDLFISQVESILTDNELVINEPNDGSAFAWCVDDINCYYRYTRSYGGDDETDQSKLIRSSLADIATNPDVALAVESTGARYVLLLDQGAPNDTRSYLFTYEDGKDWQGIESITDETPGFEIVLADGDRRLYRISTQDVA